MSDAAALRSELFKLDGRSRTVFHNAAIGAHDDMSLLVSKLVSSLDMAQQSGSRRVQDVTDGYGITALHLASKSGHTSLVNVLLDGCPIEVVNSKTNLGMTALYLACNHGHEAVVHSLLTHGSDGSIENQDNDSALRAASGFGYIDIARLLLQSSTVDVDASSPRGVKALHEAAVKGNDAIVQLLVRAGASLDALCEYPGRREARWKWSTRSELSSTALGLAVAAGHFSTVILLFDYGANINLGSETPLQLALNRKNQPTLDYLLDRGADVNAGLAEQPPLLNMIGRTMSNELDMVEKTLKLGANINARNAHGQTALMRAVVTSASGVALLRLRHGADVHMRGHSGETALHQAISALHQHNIELLLDWGADLTSTDLLGRTALHRATEQRHSNSQSVVAFLLQEGGDPLAKNLWGETPLSIAQSLKSAALSVLRKAIFGEGQNFPILTSELVEHAGDKLHKSAVSLHPERLEFWERTQVPPEPKFVFRGPYLLEFEHSAFVAAARTTMRGDARPQAMSSEGMTSGAYTPVHLARSTDRDTESLPPLTSELSKLRLSEGPGREQAHRNKAQASRSKWKTWLRHR